MTLDVTNFDRLMLDGDGSGQTQLQTKDGVVKFHNRPTTDAYVLEVKSEVTSVAGTHFGIETTVDHHPSTAASALGARGTGSICRLASGHTMTGGSLVGGYSQVSNIGTQNGAGIIDAAHYCLIEEGGGTFTAVEHVAALWLDSHLDQTITAGKSSFAYISNNGDTTFDNVFYIYAGDHITNLFTIDALGDTGIVSAATTADYTFTKYYRIKVNVNGETAYLIADVP